MPADCRECSLLFPTTTSNKARTSPMQTTQVSQLHYLPLTLPFFSILAGVFLVLVIMVQINAFQFAYMRLGM
jgi:hypothetical protein